MYAFPSGVEKSILSPFFDTDGYMAIMSSVVRTCSLPVLMFLAIMLEDVVT